MKIFCLFLLFMITGHSYAIGDCKFKNDLQSDADPDNYFYLGECKDGYAHGEGILHRINSNTYYKGGFKYGIENGKGISTYKGAGSYYIGGWKDGKWNGFGIYYLHEGDFSEDRIMGEGEWYKNRDENGEDYYVTKGIWENFYFIRPCDEYYCDYKSE